MKDEDKSKFQLIDELQKMRKQLAALTHPLKDMEGIAFEDMFNLSEIQHLQDLYAETFGVAALITRPDGTPITQPSKFTVLCSQFIRNTEKGSKNCNASYANIGQHNPEGPIIQPCLSAGLCNAGVSITVGGCHVANWLIGQVRNESQNEEDIMAYARELGADENTFRAAYHQVPGMSQEQFDRVAQVLFIVAHQLAISAYQNIQQARFITKRKRTEESLKLTKFCFDNAAIGILQVAMDGCILNANPYAARMLGYTPEELAELSIPDIDPFVSADTLDEDIDRLNARGRTNFETVLIKKDGSRIPVEITSNIFEYRGQRYSVAFVQDITERKQTEASLRLAKAIFDKAPIGIWRMGPNGEVLDVNDEGCESLGYSRKKLLQMKVFDFALGFTKEHWAENTKILNETGIKTTETFHQNKSGKSIPVQVIENLMRFENQEFLVAFVQDITERKQNEEALRERDQLLHDIGKLVKVGGWKYDIETGKATWTDEVSRIHDLESNREFGVEEGLSFYHGLHREKIQQAFNELVEQGMPYDLVIELVSAKGIRKWVRTIGYPVIKDGRIVQVQGAIQDITERKRMEEMMIQSEKMLSVGGLAAGMAHEINNPLAGMMQTAQVMDQRLSAGTNIPANQKAAEAAGTTMESIEQFMKARGIQGMIKSIMVSGQRASEIVANMLSFSRMDDTAASAHYMDRIIERTIELATTDYDLKKMYDFRQIEIIREYDENLPAIPCQSSKIQQVLLNILTNGAQALKGAETPNARFIIRTNVDLIKNMACIEIEDNGPGMDEKTRKQIFDPFFTTKPPGVGTGLGLSVSYFIITENHKGEMTVESSPGAGAKFIIRLPLFMGSRKH